MSIARLPSYDRGAKAYYAVVEAVKGSRNKFKFEPRRGLFVHDGVLPAGASYPFDFGFIPSTKGDDGDPIDILILMDEPAYVGAVVPCRLIGAIEAEQSGGDGEMVRNDRLLGVACKSHLYRDVEDMDDLPTALAEEVEHFWVSYNELKGVEFSPLGRGNAESAKNLVTIASRRLKRGTR